MKKTAICLIALLAVGALGLQADVFIKTKVHTDAMSIMGQNQPAKDEFSEQWVSKDKMSTVSDKRMIIVDNARKVITIVNHAEKSYVEAALPFDMAKLMPPEAAQMMGMMKITVKVTPNGQTRKILGFNCTGYDVEMNMPMMPMKMKSWATTEVPLDWKSFSDMYENVSKLGFMDDASIAELRKIKGMQVAFEMTGNVMGATLKVTNEVVEVVQKAAPAGTFTVPAGYAKKDKFSLQDLQNK